MHNLKTEDISCTILTPSACSRCCRLRHQWRDHPGLVFAWTGPRPLRAPMGHRAGPRESKSREAAGPTDRRPLA